MNQRFRREPASPSRTEAMGSGGSPSPELASAAAALDVADEAIRNALSEDSAVFLSHARQNGGQ